MEKTNIVSEEARGCSTPKATQVPSNLFNMHSSSVLIVHPPADSRFRLPDMSNGKLLGGGSNARHYSLDSPSLTSPPGYCVSSDPVLPNMSLPNMSLPNMSLSSMAMVDQKPHVSMSTPISMNMHSTSAMPINSSQFHSFNPATGLVMAPTAPPGLLHLGKYLNSLP